MIKDTIENFKRKKALFRVKCNTEDIPNLCRYIVDKKGIFEIPTNCVKHNTVYYNKRRIGNIFDGWLEINYDCNVFTEYSDAFAFYCPLYVDRQRITNIALTQYKSSLKEQDKMSEYIEKIKKESPELLI